MKHDLLFAIRQGARKCQYGLFAITEPTVRESDQEKNVDKLTFKRRELKYGPEPMAISLKKAERQTTGCSGCSHKKYRLSRCSTVSVLVPSGNSMSGPNLISGFTGVRSGTYLLGCRDCLSSFSELLRSVLCDGSNAKLEAALTARRLPSSSTVSLQVDVQYCGALISL